MEQKTVYAGFWLRFLALLIDAVILIGFTFFILRPLFALFGLDIGIHFAGLHKIHEMRKAHPGISHSEIIGVSESSRVAKFLVQLFLSWLYFAGMESSPKQATIGKMALGIKVTDLDGNRVSFLRATARNFSKYISDLILGIGYVIAAFTNKKQALHDLIAGTLVIRKGRQ